MAQKDDFNPKKADLSQSASGDAVATNQQKDPNDWVSGDEPMTGAQASYLKTLSEEADEAFKPDMSKAQASKRIDALRQSTGKA